MKKIVFSDPNGIGSFVWEMSEEFARALEERGHEIEEMLKADEQDFHHFGFDHHEVAADIMTDLRMVLATIMLAYSAQGKEMRPEYLKLKTRILCFISPIPNRTD